MPSKTIRYFTQLKQLYFLKKNSSFKVLQLKFRHSVTGKLSSSKV